MLFIKNIHKTTIPKLNKPIRSLKKKRRIQKHGKEPVLVCSKCKTVFPEFLARCPECGSRDWQGLSEVNPYNNAPLEQFLKLCGHLMWLGGCIACIFILWQTTSHDQSYNELLVLSAILVAAFGIFASVGYFGLSEINRRVERIQKRLRAFHENFGIHQRKPRYNRSNVLQLQKQKQQQKDNDTKQ